MNAGLARIIGTLCALAIGFGLWTLSDRAVGWVGAEALLPVIRLCVIVAGLAIMEYVVDFICSKLTSITGKVSS